MTAKKIVLIHVALFICLMIVLVLLSERILIWIAPGFHDLGMWLSLLFYGSIGILTMVGVSLMIVLFARRRKRIPISK